MSATAMDRYVGIETFEQEIYADRVRLLSHPIYSEIHTLNEMRTFMEHHIFAVWDFMSLLKTLQRQITCTQTPWMPPANALAARFINEITLGEETDEIAPGVFVSHFELYVQAMVEARANVRPIERFVSAMRETGDFEFSLTACEAPAHIRKFVQTTMQFCRLEPHEVAAAFLFGREDIIPDMFRRLLKSEGAKFEKLKVYLERHIAVDGDSHGPMARRLMETLCGHDAKKWREAMIIARAALQARCELWDGILASISG